MLAEKRLADDALETLHAMMSCSEAGIDALQGQANVSGAFGSPKPILVPPKVVRKLAAVEGGKGSFEGSGGTAPLGMEWVARPERLRIRDLMRLCSVLDLSESPCEVSGCPMYRGATANQPGPVIAW